MSQARKIRRRPWLRRLLGRIPADVPEGDYLEQQRPWAEDGEVEKKALPGDVPEADALDQRKPVPQVEEEEDHRP